MHKFINNYDIIGQNVGQIRQTSGTKSVTTGTIVPVVNMLKYALRSAGKLYNHRKRFAISERILTPPLVLPSTSPGW